ncbi:MAG TPA: riboflavin synthase [Candidatus Hydrogenedentes bacterium]|nr:riboflavin synthase [Candidatus Hydrogenedentota bacterium]HPU97364.1 riboflavin synthase [Candidatus Hydrogenedentota bacterium]
MFTGIIEEIGVIARRSGAELHIHAETVVTDLKDGDSVAVNGVCLTVAARNPLGFTVQVSPETFSRTTLGRLKAGDAVNLERALRPMDRIGGHFVLGHVDGVGQVESVTDQGEFSLWRFRAPAEVARFLIPKGSVAVDGISLTIVDPERDRFSVAVIPVTLRKTVLGMRRPGDLVNIEADVLGKHVHHFLANRTSSATGGLSLESLLRNGFA